MTRARMDVRAAALVAAAVMALAPAAMSQEKTPAPAPPGPAQSGTSTAQGRVRLYGDVYIRERAPDFTLDGSEGKIVRPSSFRGDWVVIVFADRKEMLQPLVKVQDELRSLGAKTFGVCREKAHGLQTYAKRERLPFVLGADWTAEVSALYGFYDSERSMVSPGFVIVDREGIVRMALQGHNLPPEQIAALVRFAIQGP
jgi:peroxiredoxin